MKEITEIKKIGKGQRYDLYVDGQLFGTFEAEILARYSLKTGERFDDDFFQSLQIENGDYACFNRSLALLGKSMKTEKMLRDYLREKKYPKSSIEKAINKLQEYGYINDESFCENYINCYATSKSRRKLKYDLLSKGIEETVIDTKLDQLHSPEQELTTLTALAEKYMKSKTFDLKTKQKFYSHFAGKGYDFSEISNVWEDLQNGRD